ncbi:MAG: hypothetical protein WA821_09715 [Anaerolineales bacterium]
MKNKFHQVLLILVVFILAACQATPTANPAVDFFKDQPARWISVSLPTGWTARVGGTTNAPSVIVTDTATQAISIFILPLADKGSAEQVLQVVLGRFNKLLVIHTSDIALEQVGNQSYASVEYQGKSAEQNNVAAYYLYTVISTAQRSVLVFTTISLTQETSVKPIYQSLVKGVAIH